MLASEDYRRLFDSLDQGFCVVEVIFDEEDRPRDYRFVEVNAAFERQTGMRNVVGRLIRDLTPDQEPSWFDTFARVVRTRQPERFVNEVGGLQRWYDVSAFPIGDRGQNRVAILFDDITDRKRAEERLRASAELDRFRAELSDALRPLFDPTAIQATATRVLGEFLGANRVVFAEIEGDDWAVVREDWTAGVPSLAPRRFPISSYRPEQLRAFSVGQSVVYPDSEALTISADEKARLATSMIRSEIVTPYMKGGKLTALLTVHQSQPRFWNEDDVTAIRDTAERAFAALERGRTEAALSASEQRMRLATQAADISTWEADLSTGRIESVNFEGAFGLSPHQTIEGAWTPVHEDDVASVSRALAEAVDRGQATVEFRVKGRADQPVQWARSFLRALTKDRVVGITQNITEQKRIELRERESAERDHFWTMLDHAIRPLADPIRIQFEATRLIGERLGANRVVYTEVDGDWGTDKADYVRGVEALGYERFALSAYGPDLIEQMRAGEVVVIEDIETFPLTPEEKAEFLKGEIRSAIHVPLVKDGEMVALLGVHQATPRAWTDVEVTLVEQTAEQTWAAVERAKVEASLAASEERLRLATEAADIFTWEVDLTDSTVVFSPSAEKVLGLVPASWEASWAMIHPDDVTRVKRGFEHAVRTGEESRAEYRVRDSEGQERWMATAMAPLPGSGLERPRVVGMTQNITGRKSVEQALAASERRQTFLMKLGDTKRHLSDPLEIEEIATKLLAEHLQADRCYFAEADAAGTHWILRHARLTDVPPLVDDSYPVSAWPVLDIARHGEGQLVVPDVAESTVASDDRRTELASQGIRSVVAVTVVTEARTVGALIVIQSTPREWMAAEVELIQEVAERTWASVVRARAEQNLAVSEKQYRTLFNSMDQGFCVIEVYFDQRGQPIDYRFLETNPVFEEQTGLRDAIGRTARELVPTLEEHWFEIYGRVAATGEPIRFSEGSEAMGRWFDVYAFRVGDAEAHKVAILFTDITNRKQAEERLIESEERARSAIEVARLGTFRYDPLTDVFSFDERMRSIWGQGSADPIPAEEVSRRIHPDYRADIDQTVKAALLPGGAGQYEAEFPIVLPSGEERWLVARARGQFVGKGKKRRATAVIGSALDITQQKRAEEVLRKREEHFRQLADNAPVLIWMDDAENRAIYVNAEYSRFLGRSAEDLLGNGWREAIHPDDVDRYFDAYLAAAGRRERFEGEFRFRRLDGQYRWMRSIGVPRFENGVYVGYVGSTTDIHDRKLAEEVQRLRESLERQGRQQAELLAAISGELSAIDSPDGRARRLTELLVPGFAKFASVQLPGQTSPSVSTGEGEASLELQLPIGANQVGTLSLGFGPERLLSAEDHLLFREVAERGALLIGNARLQAEEHRIARGLQRALLPSATINSTEVAVAARYEAGSDGLEIGGDWYDSFSLPGARIGLAVGDVVGTGLEAAAAMGRVRTALVALATQGSGPAALLMQLDEFVSGPNGSEFATACYAILDPSTGELRYASAAHPPALLVSPEGETRWLEAGRSLPLGSGRRPERTEAAIGIEPGSVIIFYSDGLVERRGESLSEGLARLEKLARTYVDETVEALCDRIVTELEIGASGEDDTVIMCVRLLPAEARPFRRTIPARPAELAALRTSVREWLDRRDLPQQTKVDLLLALGEACTNAVEHAYRDRPTREVEVTIEEEVSGLRVTVRDSGKWRMSDSADSKRERGTSIMMKLSEDFRRDTGDDGTVVSFTVPIGAAV